MLNRARLESWGNQIFPPEELRAFIVVGGEIVRSLQYQNILILDHLPQFRTLGEARYDIIRWTEPGPIKMAVGGLAELLPIVPGRAYRRNHVPHVYQLAV